MFGVLSFFLCLSAVIVVVFAWIGVGADRARSADPSATARLRRVFFAGLAALLLLLLGLTLPLMPYAAEAGAPDQVIHVTSRQFAFALGDAPVESLDEWDARAASSVEAKAGSSVEFRVTSLDVNHGFAVYSPSGELLIQTQAMPGYVNRLRVRFEEPGAYPLRCLEFCGLAHHGMRAVVNVR